MDFLQTYSEKIRKKYRDMEEKEHEEISGRSRNYHQYFEDWLEYRVIGKRQKPHILRVYAGSWYIPKLDSKKVLLLKIFCTIAWGVAGLFTILSGMQQNYFNHTAVGLITEAAALIGMLLCTYGLVLFLSAPYRMTIGQYKGCWIIFLRTAKFCSFACLAPSAAALLVCLYELIRQQSGILRDFLSCFLFLGSALLWQFICHLLSKVEMEIVAADYTVPPGAEKIKDRELTF